MGPDRPEDLSAEALLTQAEAGGPGAALAARRAAFLAERNDPQLALKALSLAAKLEPLDPAPRLALARLHAEAGELEAAQAEAAGVLAESIDQGARARAAFMLGELARVRGDMAPARKFYETTMRIEDALLTAQRSDPTAARWYARARGRVAELDASIGDGARARTGAEGALALLRAAAAQIGETPILAADIADAEMRLAAIELDHGQANSARRRLNEAIGRYEALAVVEEKEPHWRAVLADAWALAAEADYVRNAPDEARTAMDKALQARVRLAANFPGEAWGLAGTWRLRAALRTAVGDTEIAAQSLAQARALAEQLAAQSQSDIAARFLIHTLLDQADQALRAGDLNQAREAADTARMQAEALATAENGEIVWHSEAAACWDRLGEVARRAGAAAQLQDALSRAVEFRRLARERAPANDARAARGLAAALLKLGDALLQAESNASARAAFNESVALRLALMDATPQDKRTAHALATALERLGLAALACGDGHAARGAWADELALAERIFAYDDLEGLRFCAIVESHLAGLGGIGADDYRKSALARFDALAQAGMMTEREAALRRKLWGG